MAKVVIITNPTKAMVAMEDKEEEITWVDKEIGIITNKWEDILNITEAMVATVATVVMEVMEVVDIIIR